MSVMPPGLSHLEAKELGCHTPAAVDHWSQATLGTLPALSTLGEATAIA